ncbi:hypothetical protein [Sediminitomix flava]|uniref:Uncharacterized protein n=1 Tax=Sediminitomix flava TaxID=379075 RepID=A0A315Z5E4_SEDFL|nr:hypothetical protein [Sediminitomix flava]PWJ39128.1 hypothetical protein BC781_10629 [Sediminitomix flava]
MNIKEIEAKIVELKGKQSEIISKKKADRDAAALEAIRKELNELKAQATSAYAK